MTSQWKTKYEMTWQGKELHGKERHGISWKGKA